MLNAVINSTPIISLHAINKLDILCDMYHKIYIPKAVFDEVCIDGNITICKEKLLLLPCLSIEEIKNEVAKKYFKTSLHKGEVETMILADELKANLCILDDRVARNYAKALGLRVTGTLGILLKAKEKKLIDKVTPYMDMLISQEIYISTELYKSIQRLSGE